MKFTFKKEPCETGLAGCGHPYPDTTIKHEKKPVGTIYAPTWQTKDHKWHIGLMAEGNTENPNCSWQWVFPKERFDSEQAARDWLQANADKIADEFTLHHEEDD